MRYFIGLFVIFFILIGFAGTVHAEETFSGHSSIDPPISEITPRKPTTVTVLFQYTSGPYAITDLTPQVEITPQSAAEYVKIDVEPIELNRGDIRRIPIMVTVDQDIPHEKIFLSISFSGKHFLADSVFTSSWFESLTLDVAPKDMIGFDLGDCKPIEIDYEFSGDKNPIFCKSQRTNSVKAFFDAKTNGTITLDIPNHVLYGISSRDCKLDNNFFVKYDGEEIAADITRKDSSNLVSVDFESGIHEIEIIGWFILPSPSPVQYCGIVENYPKTYLPPLDQIQHDMEPSQIRCNDGLVLLHKYDDSPACVTESTKQKLIERGWTKSNTTHESTTNLPLHKNQDANELPSYRDISSSIQISENASILSDKELDRTLEELRQAGLPIVMSAIDYQKRVIAIWMPDVSNEEPFRKHLGDIPFVLLFEEAPPRWETGDPEPEPDPNPVPEPECTDGKCTCPPAWIYSDVSKGCEMKRTPPPEPPIKDKEPQTKVEVMFGNRLDDGLLPIKITEVITNAQSLDEITVWNFEPIGHSGDDRRVAWDVLPKDMQISYKIVDGEFRDIRD